MDNVEQSLLSHVIILSSQQYLTWFRKRKLDLTLSTYDHINREAKK
jgi:hypothetical protein